MRGDIRRRIRAWCAVGSPREASRARLVRCASTLRPRHDDGLKQGGDAHLTRIGAVRRVVAPDEGHDRPAAVLRGATGVSVLARRAIDAPRRAFPRVVKCAPRSGPGVVAGLKKIDWRAAGKFWRSRDEDFRDSQATTARLCRHARSVRSSVRARRARRSGEPPSSPPGFVPGDSDSESPDVATRRRDPPPGPRWRA